MSWGKNLTGFGPHTTTAKNVQIQTENAAKQMAEVAKGLEADGFTQTAHDEWSKVIVTPANVDAVTAALDAGWGKPLVPRPSVPATDWGRPAPAAWPDPKPAPIPAPTLKPALPPSPVPVWPNPATPEPAAPVTEWKPVPLPEYMAVPEQGPKDYYAAYQAGVSYVVLSGPYASIEECERHYDVVWTRFMNDKVMELPFPVAKRKRENLYVCAIKAGSRRTGSYGKLKA